MTGQEVVPGLATAALGFKDYDCVAIVDRGRRAGGKPEASNWLEPPRRQSGEDGKRRSPSAARRVSDGGGSALSECSQDGRPGRKRPVEGPAHFGTAGAYRCCDGCGGRAERNGSGDEEYCGESFQVNNPSVGGSRDPMCRLSHHFRSWWMTHEKPASRTLRPFDVHTKSAEVPDKPIDFALRRQRNELGWG